MAHTIEMGEDGILRVALLGDIDGADLLAFQRDLNALLAQASADERTPMLVDAVQEGKFSTSARKMLAELVSQEDQLGKTAIINATRFTRMLVFFLSRVARGADDDINFFDSEAEAIGWLKE
jgi:hypothetical protein